MLAKILTNSIKQAKVQNVLPSMGKCQGQQKSFTWIIKWQELARNGSIFLTSLLGDSIITKQQKGSRYKYTGPSCSCPSCLHLERVEGIEPKKDEEQ